MPSKNKQIIELCPVKKGFKVEFVREEAWGPQKTAVDYVVDYDIKHSSLREGFWDFSERKLWGKIPAAVSTLDFSAHISRITSVLCPKTL